MASLSQLQSDVVAWLNRRDIAPLIPSWVTMTETDISELLRARCMVVRGSQGIDGNFIGLPSGFLEMESMRDATTGKKLDLEDHWTGPLEAPTFPMPLGMQPACTAYRLVGDCIEFLPHPILPSPVPVGWVPQTVNMAWYEAPRPLVNVADTNPVLEKHYSIYLFGVCRYGAMYELDDARQTQMDAQFGTAIEAANRWKVRSDYSGAPLRAVVRGFG